MEMHDDVRRHAMQHGIGTKRKEENKKKSAEKWEIMEDDTPKMLFRMIALLKNGYDLQFIRDIYCIIQARTARTQERARMESFHH